jgi:hypothetical protein
MEYSALALPRQNQSAQGDSMSDTDATGFAKFVPGFDFLQNLAKGASASVPQMPNMGSWVAPTLNIEELDKRIEELKNVQFWLEQNSRALSATIQALEVQRMTLATLKGMNFNLSDLASAFQMKSGESAASTARQANEKAAAASKAADEVASGVRKAAEKPAEKPADQQTGKGPEQSTPASAGAGMGDPLQLWGALTQQFQQIASHALQEVTAKAGIDLSKNMAAAKSMASGMTKEAAKAKPVAAKKAPAKKAAARKPAARKTSSR